jgi:23S rRNA pseudouridine2605 synthase
MSGSASFTLASSGAPERIAKHIARAGVCSRRDAEARIADGRVTVNGEVISSPALNVTLADEITVDGKRLPAREAVKLWRYHKPRGLVVTDRDEKDRETIFDALPASLGRVLSVGRLDMDSEGLILLTNDGGLARHLELPSTGWSRKYRVRVQGHVNTKALEDLAGGVTVDGVRYGDIHARLDRQMASNAWLTIAIREGKNREVRRIMEYLGHHVSRLIRISYGPFMLGDLPAGETEIVRSRVLADQLGITAPVDADDKPAGGTAPKRRRQSGHKFAGKAKSNFDSRAKTKSDAGPNARSGTLSLSGKRQDADNRRPASRHKAGPTRQR